MYIKKKNKLSLYTPLNVLGLGIMLFLNTMAVVLPLNGYNTGELSDKYPNLFVPTGLTFAIWGLLYFCLIGFVIYGFLIDRSNTNRHENPMKSISPIFFVSCVLNAAWIVCWHYLLVAQSVIVMVLLLLSLVVLYERLYDRRFSTIVESFFVKGTISLYLGWISVALIANVTAYWVSTNATSYGLSEITWTILLISIAAGLSLYFSIFKKDVLYSAVILWALYGIYLKHTGFFENAYPGIVITTQVSMGLVALGIALGGFRIFKRV